MRKLVLRFIVALLCFGLGILAIRLLTALLHRPTPHIIVYQQREKASSGAAIADTVARLRRIQTDQFDANIPPAAKPLLSLLKSQLIELIGNTINSERQDSPQHLQAAIQARLQNMGVTVRKQEDVIYSPGFFQNPYTYGDIYGITIEEPAGHPELRVATTTLGINCGEDTSLYVFKHDGSQWQMVLAQEANDYDKVSGAQGMFQYAVSPATSTGDFFVVTANVNPWCSSNWQTLRYKVLRTGPDSYRPRTLLSAEETIYLGGGDPPYRLFVKDDYFKLMFYGETNSDEISRKSAVSYSVNGDQVTKVAR